MAASTVFVRSLFLVCRRLTRQFWPRMRIVWALFLGFGAAFAAVASAPPARLPETLLFGRQCVDLAAWAKSSQLQMTWERRSGAVRVSNPSTRLTFTVDSRRAEINGVQAWLSVPIIPYRDRVYIASIDLQTLLRPILNPPRNEPGRKVRVVALDPGHGGKDPGNQAGRDQEKNLTLLLAAKVRTLLRDAGLRVVLTRYSDQFVDLPERPALAKKQRADLFVSLHYNSTDPGNAGVKGVEVYCLTPKTALSTNARGDSGSTESQPVNRNDAKNALLAYQVHKAVVRTVATEDRGLRRARFSVLRTADMPAVLVEGGFMTSAEESRAIMNGTRRDQLARAIVEGILAYKRLVERPGPKARG